MKRLLVVCVLVLLSGCMPNIQDIVKQQAQNCASHFSGSFGGGMLGTQTGVVAFSIDCNPTGAPATGTTPPVATPTPTKSPL